MENIEQRVKKIVAEQLGVNEAEIKTDSSFVDDLGADSLDTVELVMALEEEFECEIPDEDPRGVVIETEAMRFRIPRSQIVSITRVPRDGPRYVVLPVVGAKPPAERLTITPPVIEAAREVAVIAAGEDKATMVARAIEGPLAPKAVPVQLARRGTWFLDQAAAARLAARRVPT